MEIHELLKSVCAPGTETEVKMVPVSEKVSLRLFSFTPESKRQKPDIVFVAGWITQIDSWGDVLKEMTRTHRVRSS